MTVSEIKKMIKIKGIQSWFEAGVDVVAVGDKMLSRDVRFSRLDFYAKYNALQFCSEDELVIPCGEIILATGQKIFYNITKSPLKMILSCILYNSLYSIFLFFNNNFKK